ncbi:hypothetical protein, partial [Prolixibacter bellariivorans]
MKGKNIYLSLLLALLFASCSSTQYQKLNDGIVLTLHQKGKTATHKVRLQVLGDELIHISATPDKNFPKDSSLIIVPG